VAPPEERRGDTDPPELGVGNALRPGLDEPVHRPPDVRDARTRDRVRAERVEPRRIPTAGLLAIQEREALEALLAPLVRPEREADRDDAELIVGGRQSAFETAALLAESGAERVDIVHRHDPPRFMEADWGFVEPLMKATLRWPGWFRSLPTPEREAIERRFWAEGRLKLEPWLTPRLARPEIRRWANATVSSPGELPGGAVAARLSGGELLHADHIILATGYKADLAKVPYLAGVLDQVQIADGFPILDERFQTSVPGLFITGFAATRDFGPFFGFVRGSTVAAEIIARAQTESASRPSADDTSRPPARTRARIVTRHAETADRARVAR
jgi:hypothetical protein